MEVAADEKQNPHAKRADVKHDDVPSPLQMIGGDRTDRSSALSIHTRDAGTAHISYYYLHVPNQKRPA